MINIQEPAVWAECKIQAKTAMVKMLMRQEFQQAEAGLQ